MGRERDNAYSAILTLGLDESSLKVVVYATLRSDGSLQWRHIVLNRELTKDRWVR